MNSNLKYHSKKVTSYIIHMIEKSNVSPTQHFINKPARSHTYTQNCIQFRIWFSLEVCILSFRIDFTNGYIAHLDAEAFIFDKLGQAHNFGNNIVNNSHWLV